jgi:dTDP-4-amino-4,6-dideoxygalactose transaminase
MNTLTPSKVSFVDLRAQNEEVRPEIEAAISDIINHSSFIGGSYVSAFEKQFAEYVGVKEAVAVANGTDALWLCLKAAGVKPGQAVVTVPNTFIATTEAITRVGASPLFVDIDLDTANMSIEALKVFLEEECIQLDSGKIIHRKTKHCIAAIMPVHLYGLPVDLAPLIKTAEAYNIPIIEDACQAHGAKYCLEGQWKRVGSFGLAAGFSFYPGKNLGAMGDGGAVVTNHPDLAEKIRWLRDHGSSEKYIHITSEGWNSRLDAIQAAVLSAKLKKLDEWNQLRRKAARLYREALSGLPMTLPVDPSYAEHVYHLYVVRVENREHLRKELVSRGVGAALHYPIPLHLQQAYNHLGLKQDSYPNAECSAATILSLPMHPALTEENVNDVAEACKQILTAVTA